MRTFSRVADRIVASYALTAWNPRGPVMDRSFYAPKNSEIITPEGTDLDIRIREENGVWYGVAFAGKANRPMWNYRFRNREQLDKQIADTISSRKSHMDYKQKRQQERQEYKHTLVVGDILYSSWGYDQTNVDFYQVTAVGQKSVKIRQIEQKVVGSSTGSESVVGVPNRFAGPEETKLVRPGDSVRLTSYSSAYKWDGKPKYQTAAGFGH